SNPGTYFSDYVYPSYDIYLARIGKQDQFTKPQSQLINETKAYYASLNIDQPLMKLGEASIIGFLGGDSYHEPYQNYLKAMVKTQDYSVSSSPFAAYAFFCTRDGLYDQSLETYKELFKLNEKWINDLIFTFGEKAFITYFNSKLKDGYNDYHSLVRLLVEAKDERSAAALAQAYDNILLTKSIAFKSSQKRKKAFMKQNSPEIVALYQTWLDKKQQLLRAYQMKQEAEPKVQVMDVEELQNEVHQIENELATNSKNYKELLTIDHPKWQEVRNNLKEGEAAVELIRFNWRDQLFYSDSAYYAAYVITKESKYPEVIYLPTMAKDLDGKFYNYYTNSVKLKSDNSSAFQAYWAPIQSQLQGVKKVYFSADGIYHLINLPTLKNPTTDQYLLDEIDIQYITSTSDIGSSHQSSASKNAVLMGRPAYETGEADKENEILKPEETRSFIRNFRNNSVSDLPGTEEEVLAIEQVMQPQGMTVTTYIGASATEEVLYALEQPDILHIATHGYWSASEDGASPGFRMFNAMINSGLLLAGVVDFYQSDLIPNTHDGILTAYEAQNLDLENTDLVVLSACETGLGHFDAGEGVYGLQRAFRSAGAKSVINSLWKVDDEATKDFMIAFYSHYLAGESKFDAFSNTQKEMKSKYVDPYFWGAFVLVGE
ncbi:MAG: CHAT domain-containing protein, partial [Reichenbachiella sp.]